MLNAKNTIAFMIHFAHVLYRRQMPNLIFRAEK